jgi:hypothetical protein
LKERPALMAHVGAVTALQSELEQWLGRLFVRLLGAEARLGTAIFLSLRSEAPQRDAISAVADLRLEPEMAKKVSSFLADLRKSRERNEVVHGIWGVSDDHTDALFQMNQQDQMHWLGMLPLSGGAYGAAALELSKHAPRIMMYKVKDFEAILHRMTLMLGRIGNLLLEIEAHLLQAAPESPPQ